METERMANTLYFAFMFVRYFSFSFPYFYDCMTEEKEFTGDMALFVS